MGTAREPVSVSGLCPECRARVLKPNVRSGRGAAGSGVSSGIRRLYAARRRRYGSSILKSAAAGFRSCGSVAAFARIRMVIILTILHILICFFMIVVVLLQSGQAADLAGAFGGMGSQTAFGPRGSATILTKATTIAAALFMVTSMSLAILATRAAKASGSVLENQKAPITQPANKQQARRHSALRRQAATRFRCLRSIRRPRPRSPRPRSRNPPARSSGNCGIGRRAGLRYPEI